ncbi:zinc finger protein 91 isoform X1 [Episyrphus balteatus]|uniref:zinc finger protein 91 isoform X1 n=1 Tax=Episyrphus balteatus TaxID=286459 RepID=UPI002485F957|nr:zinc finger protein 91 isoform X1 [Episyrphus balteatus]
MEEIDLIKPLENLNIEEVCRACFETCEQYKNLFDDAESIDQRTLGDVFFDVVKIEMKANAETPPCRICLSCASDLINAYNFIQKSQKNNGRLLQYLINANIKKADCLTEFPMDIPMDNSVTDFLQIKVENEALHDYDYNESIPDNDRNSSDINFDSDESDYEPLVSKKEKLKKLQCTYCDRVFKRQDFFENHMKKHKEEDVKKKEIDDSDDEQKLECDDCDFSCSSKMEMKKHQKSDHPSSKKSKKPLKTRSQRTNMSTRSKTKQTKEKSGRFECDHCSKTFAWKKDLFRHEKSHEPNTKKYSCPHCDRRFIRKDKLQSHVLVHLGGIVKPRCSKATLAFSRQLYSQEKFKEIVCMICSYDKAENIKELSKHISSHDGQQIEGFENSEYVKKFYADKDLQEVMMLLGNQIEQKEFGKLHSVINVNGLEMGISDSDESDPETLYTCEVCTETFNRKHKLIAHSLSGHTVDECLYKCDKCKLEFTCKEVYDSHQKHHCNNADKDLHCENCPARFVWPQNLANHKCTKETESGKDKTICEPCGEIFATQKAFRLHKKTKCGTVELDKESTTCEICNKVFSFPRDLRKHKKIHIPDGKSHDCSVCGEKFLRSDNLRNHLKSHTSKVERPLVAKKLICMLCGDKFTTIGSLRYHLFNHSDGQSEIDFENSGFVLNFYPGVGKEVVSEYIKNCFNEQKLSQLYLAVNKIGLEMTLSDSDSDDDEQSFKYQETPSKTYVCELCNVKFPRRQAIIQHQYAEHDSKDNNFPHKCVKCEDQFVSGALLERHFKSECQNEARTNACVKCGIKFIWKENLVAHTCFKEEKSPEENKQCEVCGKKFIWLKDLHRHKRSHIPYEKKFECLICARKFNRKDNMRAHMKVHTSENQVKDKGKASIKWEQQDENLCKPNGQKVIQCKICLSKHNTIKDLTNHLMSHKDPATFKQREAEAREISMMIYGKQMEMQTLERAICKDLEKGSNTRFYSITNEAGYELNLNDSETCSDFDADDDDDDDDDDDMLRDRKVILKGYNCQICCQNFNRKFKIFEHQRTDHQWEELPYECNRCGSKYVCEKIYQLHLQNDCENNEKQFKCKTCPMKFAWKENLKNHEKYMHDQNPAMPKKHHCDICGKSFLWVKDLTRHQKTHQTEDEKFECTWCFRVFMRRDNLKVHMKVHQNATHILLPDIYYLARPNGAKLAQCKLCDQQYTNISDLAEHIQNGHIKLQMLSITPNPASYSITNALGYEMDINDSETEREGEDEKYVCDLCDARYNRRFKLLQHQQSLHYSDNIPHKCIDCSFKCVSELVLNYHMRTQCMNLVKQFRCSKCTMRFMWKENLENHESLIHDGKRKHTCTVCKKDFATQHDLRNHTECKAPAEEKLFKCDLCDRKYNRKDRLMKHAKVHAPGGKETKPKRIKSETADKKFLCAFCGKEVSSSSNLVIHMRRHTGEKPFKCEFCNKGFPRSSDLACHRRTHTGERPHKCTVCEKAFSRSYKLQTHMRIHSGERPYKCTYCEKSFTQSNDLTLHVRRHTGERPYVCETCGERFIQGTALKNHRRMRGHYEI